MPYELLYTDQAQGSLDRLEADPSMARALNAINLLLDQLEKEPFDRRLGTDPFQLQHHAGVNATPARFDEWYIIWRRGPRNGTLLIIAIARLDV